MKSWIIGFLAVAVLVPVVGARSDNSNVGQKFPAGKLAFIKGQADLSGKPRIVEFWATWCPPCRQSIPHLNEIYKKYKDQGLEIVGITGENPSEVRAFIKKVPMDYLVAHDSGGKLAGKFGVTGIPHAIVVNKDNVIVWEGHPMSLPEGEIKKILP
ncbi:MAG: TlpA family protein disulfide reductase [Verrucomicrobia bacterium]|nr:MAG: TlpA family protein disulfide reductase [Verrucomicrobiota bacterium]